MIWAMTSDLDFYRIIWGRPYGLGFCGLRYASEHPADGSPLGPANPSRNFVFRLKYFFWAMPSAQATPGSLSLGFCFAKNQALCIPIAGYTKLLRLEIGIDGFNFS